MVVRKVFYAVSTTTTGVHLVYTVPPGVVDTMEAASVTRYGGGSHYVELGLKRSGVFFALTNAIVAGTPGVMPWNGKQVMEPGDQVYVYNPDAATLNVWGSGFESS